MQKIFKEDLFIRTPSITLLQIFFKLMLYSKFIFQKHDRSRRNSSGRSPGMKGAHKEMLYMHIMAYAWCNTANSECQFILYLDTDCVKMLSWSMTTVGERMGSSG